MHKTSLTHIFVGFLLAALICYVGAAKPKGASLTLKARFNATSYLLEAVEFLAEEDAALVWSFLDSMSDSKAAAGGADLDDDACWRTITCAAAELVTPSVGKLIPLTLASRQYAAKLQMVRQLAEQFHPQETSPPSEPASCCFVSVDGAVATTPTMLAALLAGDNSSYVSYSSSEQLFSFDHVYHGKAATVTARPPRVAVLYGTPGLPCFAPLYRQLRAASDHPDSDLAVAFRPLLLAACEPLSGCARAGTGGQLLLPGWGVEAALKNTEYSAMDDKEVAKQRQQQGKCGEVGPGFRDQLMAADDDEMCLAVAVCSRPPSAPLASDRQVWDLRDVGLQATQRILGSSDPLALLAEMSQNFPGLVSSLSRQAVNSSLRSAVAHNQQYISAGGNFLLLNGLAVDVNNFDFFGFLARLRSEMRLRDTLVEPPLELPPSLAQRVLALRAEEGAGAGGGGGGAGGGGSGDAEPRLSLGSSSTMSKHVAFLNDLEKDAKYQRFGRNLGDLLQTFPGRLRPLARNAFTSVVVSEPLCAQSLELAISLDRMWQGGYPIRFGVVFQLPAVVGRLVQQRKHPQDKSGVPTWEEMDASERFGRGFATIREAFGPAAAWRMWVDAAEAVTSGYADDPREVVETAFSSAWVAAARSPPPGARARLAARRSAADALKMLREGSGYAAEVGMQLTETAAWLLAKGLVTPPPAAADGIHTDAAAADDDDEDREGCSSPPVVWVNGLVARSGGAEQPAEDLMYKVMGEMQRLQEAIYFGRLDDDSAGGDLVAAILALQGGVVERLNQRIVGPQARDAQVVSLAPLLRHAAHPTLRPLYGEYKSESETEDPHVAAVTHYVVVDVGSGAGRELLGEALRFLSEVLPASSSSSSATRDSRVVLVANPLQPHQPPSPLELTVQGAISQQQPGNVGGGSGSFSGKVVSFLTRLLGDSELVARLGGEPGAAVEGAAAVEAGAVQTAAKYADDAGLNGEMLVSYVTAALEESRAGSGGDAAAAPSVSYRTAHSDLCRTIFRLEPGAAAVISNGRVTPVYKPGGERHELLAEDMSLLQLVSGRGVAAAVARALHQAQQELEQQQHHQQEGTEGAAIIRSLRASGAESASVWDALSERAAAVTSALAAAARAATHDSSASAASRGLGPGASLQLQQVLGMLRGQALEVAGGTQPPFHVEAILNPLSRPAQRLSAVLLLLRAALGPSMSLTLNPQRDVTEMPLKSYYRYSLPQGLNPGGGPPGPPAAYFSRLPSRRVLTLNLDAPEAWLLEPAAALYDLDNLRLEDVAGEVAFAEFELDALMLTGSCVDVTASGRMTPPRGLQLHLGTPAQPHLVDTLVMANLAYFQLKASPGLWVLSLAPGRSQDLYLLQSSTGTSLDAFADEAEEEGQQGGVLQGSGGRANDDVSTQVLISSFLGKHMILRVRKRPGMEAEDVLQADGAADESYDAWDPDLEDDEYDDDDEKPSAPSPGLLGKVSSLLTGGGGAKKLPQQQPRQLRGGDTINVFTVASGHMYERLQKIMILSVLRHTKSKVKFWIIKNYMSPQHKQVIPAMAEQFGFEYEFVTYKWPHWLHKQTDKQRLIWAYKILFLDVLFPLGIDRIIFVDSDQVVQSDLAELYHMDIKGAPYAYTPFCNNNKEMDEYRFWTGGFWRDHLQGKPYHISALYLVDLKRFRQVAAGDQLRVVYDQLSKDPNSLANLDQDLPNYAQHSIRIHSLPPEWLWCESWCGNATKAKAKTIDLCNNPKTKEPKLTAARRIIGPLWEELDRQQEEVTRAVQRMLEASEEAVPPPPPGQPPAGAAGRGGDEGAAAGDWQPVEVEDEEDVSAADSPEQFHDPTEL